MSCVDLRALRAELRELHHGHIEVQSTLGTGTRFEISLPVADDTDTRGNT